MANPEKLRKLLEQIKQEHRSLDIKIQSETAKSVINSIEIQRLKRRKLILKDEIVRIENELLPDIIA